MTTIRNVAGHKPSPRRENRSGDGRGSFALDSMVRDLARREDTPAPHIRRQRDDVRLARGQVLTHGFGVQANDCFEEIL